MNQHHHKHRHYHSDDDERSVTIDNEEMSNEIHYNDERNDTININRDDTNDNQKELSSIRALNYGPELTLSSSSSSSSWRPSETQSSVSSSAFPLIPNFQLSPNFLLPQMPNLDNYLPSMANFTNITMPSMPSLPDYRTLLPTVSMPNLTMPNLTMPNLTMPNLSIPSMPSMPSMPSFANLMNSVANNKLTKSWAQLRQSVKSSHRRFSEIGCRVPFMFNWREDPHNDNIRIYFLSSLINTSDITLLYCDVNTDCNDKDKDTDERDNPDDYTIKVTDGEIFVTMKDKVNDDNDDITESYDNDVKKDDFRSLWKPLITSSRSLHNPLEEIKYSREENLQLERKRIMYSGITSYEYDSKSSRFVFTSGGSILWFDDPLDNGIKSPPYLPNKLDSGTTYAKMNPQICPSNANLVAFVADSDLWVCNLISGHEMRLTQTKFDNDGRVISAGTSSYVIQEEFRRYNGFWWRPDSEYDHIEDANGDVSHAILCEFIDDTDVEVIKIASWDGNVEEYRFPRPGQCNSVSSLSLVTFNLNVTTNTISHVELKPLPLSLTELYPSCEYVARVGFHSHDNIWLELLNRAQNHLIIVLMSLHNSYPPQIIYNEQSSLWINCHDILNFSNTGANLSVGSYVSFVWSSEESGYRHLYLITVQLTDGNDNGDSDDSIGRGNDAIDAKCPKLDNGTTLDINRLSNCDIKFNHNIKDGHLKEKELNYSHPNDNAHQSLSSEKSSNIEMPLTKSAIKSKLIEKRQLTFGNWEVSDKDVWYDEINSLIYFTGLKESPLERHLYVISLNHPKLPPKRLTAEDFSHTSVAFAPSFKYFIDIQSNISLPPFGFLQGIVPSGHLPESENVSLFLGTSANPGDDNDQIDHIPGMSPPQLFDYKLKTGELIYGFIFKPECMESGVRYPVVLEVYGGPEVQLVNKSFKSVRHCRRHLLASEGYIVIAFDSRGSKHRGVSFESYIHRRMGQVEIADQVEALQWLAENTQFIDMSRVAVHGWSYGGYLSLMALAQRPDIFKCAIAGAPVTNWRLYDTGYTERYMDTPENNPEGYRLGNVMTHINLFPNDENRLLIIHGLMDENVHFAHTVQLVQALIKAGKPYQLQVYPFERHSLRHSQCSEHYETCLLSFLQQNL